MVIIENDLINKKTLKKLEKNITELVVKREKILMQNEIFSRKLAEINSELENLYENSQDEDDKLIQLKFEIDLKYKEIENLYSELKEKQLNETCTDSFIKLQKIIESKEQIYSILMKKFNNIDKVKIESLEVKKEKLIQTKLEYDEIIKAMDSDIRNLKISIEELTSKINSIESKKVQELNKVGYIAINENNETFYIPDGDSVELTIIRVLKGTKFRVINLSEVSEDKIKYIEKV